MQRTPAVISIVILLILCAASIFTVNARRQDDPLSAPHSSLALTGRVTDEFGLPVAGAALRLFDPPRVFIPQVNIRHSTSGRSGVSPQAVPIPPAGKDASPDLSIAGLVDTTVSDAGGYYTFTQVIPGYYRLVPTKTGYTFNPAAQFVHLAASISSRDFTASPSEMVRVPAGDFHMGCAPSDATCGSNENPLHKVYLYSYEIDKNEVTNARYAACVLDGACTPPHQTGSSTRAVYYGSSSFAGYPVIHVDWDQASAFCAWDGKRLPTEAEWEMAARGGRDTRIYPWGDLQAGCELANIGTPTAGAFCVGDTTPAGSYPASASPSGAQDMAGNVMEWVSDWYQADYYSSQSCWSSPPGGSAGTERGVRGGSWYYYWGFQRASARFKFSPDFSSNSVGFRCARSLPAPDLPPNLPSDPVPADKGAGLSLDAQLSWVGGDPQGDVVTYTVYFEAGDATPDVLVSTGQVTQTYNPGTLSPGASYFWQIIAANGHGLSTPGPIWTFNTTPGGFNPSEMVRVPSGYFQMGCSPIDGGCSRDERPLHPVYVSDYEIDKYEVTNARYKACADAGVCSPPQDDGHGGRETYYGDPAFNNFPVIGVNWNQADAFCSWDGRRLPSEAEWEKAARGSGGTRLYPWGNQPPDDRANYCDPPYMPPMCFNNTSSVDSYPSGASPYGALNLAGNVNEWVKDWFQFDYYGSQTAWINPTGPVSGTAKLQRGGAYAIRSAYLRVSDRLTAAPAEYSSFLGFRCARTIASPIHAPSAPSEPMPANGALGLPPVMQLAWTSIDVEGDLLSYDVYLAAGEADPDVLVSQGQLEPVYRPKNLIANTHYSWQIIARDEYGTSTPGPVWSFTTASWPIDPFEMVGIPAGDFQMGCAPSDAACSSDENPLHTVYLDAYQIDKYEVTNARYTACVEAGKCSLPHQAGSSTRPAYFISPTYGSYPVIQVDWNQAFAFCAWEGKRLPAEAEWEKAARGSSGARLYPWGDQPAGCTRANIGGGDGTFCLGDTAQAGSYPSGASPYGAMDMAGNALEWVGDWYQGDYYGSQAAWISPSGPAGGSEKVLRGGSWDSGWSFQRVSARLKFIPGFSSSSLGFRCAASPLPLNLSPALPSDPAPAQEAVGVWPAPRLSWLSGDPDGDVVTYTVYLQAEVNPPGVVVSDAQEKQWFIPGTLSASTRYFWQVIARDEHGASTVGPVWSFTTGSGIGNPSEVVSIPAGVFQMGCSPDDYNCREDERPLHPVYVCTFDIDKYEVTNARYKACVDAGSCTAPHSFASRTQPSYYGNLSYDMYPVIQVDWNQAAEFCAWDGKRLPTEAEWEMAARGGGGTRIYPWGSQWPDCTLANGLLFLISNRGYMPCHSDTSPVGDHPINASPDGVMDMAGNVWEWVGNWYQANYPPTAATCINPTGPASGTARVIRGGGFYSGGLNIRASSRSSFSPVGSDEFTGFRCARSP